MTGRILQIAFVIAVLDWLPVSGQGILDLPARGATQGQSVEQWFLQVEAQHPVRFFFVSDWLKTYLVEQDYNNQTLGQVLDDVFRGSDLTYVVMNNYGIVLVRDPSRAIERRDILNVAQRERKKVEPITIGQPGPSRNGENVELRGRIADIKNQEALAGASVFVQNLSRGTTTDAEGNFRLQLPPGEHVLSVSYVNYEEKVADLKIYQSGTVSLMLEEVPRMLQEIVVEDQATREITTNRIGSTTLRMTEIKRAPAMLGEVDLIKQVQTLPGVTSVGEAASGFNVRGGSVDQNLILYDGNPVFNSSHVFGFFSAFNSDALREVNFYRGGISAEYGGRVSSVLDIRSKEGDLEKWTGSGGIGMISSNFSMGGPVKKDKTSFSASFRSSYSDWLVNAIESNYIDLDNSSVFFYDGSAKLAHKFGDRTKLSASFYTSHDKFRLDGDTTYRWDNVLGSVRLDHTFSESLQGSLLATFGRYSYGVEDADPITGATLRYDIAYPSVKADFSYITGRHKIGFGLQSTYYKFNPGTLTPSGPESVIKPVTMEPEQSLETAAYVGDGITLGEKTFLELGLRYSFFQSLGPATINLYEPGLPIEIENQVGTETFGSGEVIQSYSGLEPRLSFRYSLTPGTSVKAGYNRIYQYVHLVSNTTAITPVDIWQSSNYYFKPQYGDQVSLGYYANFRERQYEFFVEGYYKKIENILDFEDGAQLILNDHLETDLLQGVGTAYGIETQLSKPAGRLNGAVSYAYSRSLRQIAGPTPDESINNGNEYPSNYDQPHMVNLSWKYGISRRFYFSGYFTYRTGRPVTVPVSAYSVEGITIADFSDRNEYRIPDYHRLDLALIMEGNHKRRKFWDGTWTFSVYNVYSRKNPYTIFFKDDGTGRLKAYQLSIVGTALPSLSYSFRF